MPVWLLCAVLLLQGHRQEVIGSLKDVVQDMLKEFYRRNNGKKPEAIIYYRDGVADSQFPVVLEYEYTAFRQVGHGDQCSGQEPSASTREQQCALGLQATMCVEIKHLQPKNSPEVLAVGWLPLPNC